MFIKTHSKPDSTEVTVQIAESKRIDGKLITEILRHVGVANNDQELEELKLIAGEMITKVIDERDQMWGRPTFSSTSQREQIQKIIDYEIEQTPIAPLSDVRPVTEVLLSEITDSERILEGVEEIAGKVYDELGLGELLNFRLSNNLMRSLVLSRTVTPAGKRKLQKCLEKQYAIYHDLDSVYRVTDEISRKTNEIKSIIFNHTQKLCPGPMELILFDITQLYFESTENNTGLFDPNKDNKGTPIKMMLALATNKEGLPLTYELIPVNQKDVSSFCAMIESWKKCLPINKICFIAGKQFFSEYNLDYFDKLGYNYIIQCDTKHLPRSVQDDLLNDEQYQIQSYSKEIGWLVETTHQKRRIIGSCRTKAKPRSIKKLRNIFDKTISLYAANPTSKKEEFQSMLNDIESQTAGFWNTLNSFVTNLPQNYSPLEILIRFSRGHTISDFFNVKKQDLKLRPVGHWKNDRIEAHIAVNYVSYAVLHYIQFKVAQTQKMSLAEIAHEMLNIQSSIIKHKETRHCYRIPAGLTDKSKKIYRVLGIKRPHKTEIYTG